MGYKEWEENNTWSHSTYQKRKSLIINYLPPLFKKLIHKIARTDIVELIKNIEAQGKHETASKTLTIIKQVFDYAVICGEAENNPATGLNSIIKKVASQARATVLAEKDISRLVQKINELDNEILKIHYFITYEKWALKNMR